MAQNTQVIGEGEASRHFSEGEIAQARGTMNGFLGEKGGIKYFLSSAEVDTGGITGKGSSVRMPDQMGDRTE